jgi:hypothetical protein
MDEVEVETGIDLLDAVDSAEGLESPGVLWAEVDMTERFESMVALGETADRREEAEGEGE